MSSPLTNLLGAPPFRPQAQSTGGKSNLADQSAMVVNGSGGALQPDSREQRQANPSRRSLTRTMSVGVPSQSSRPSALSHHRSLQRSTSFESHAMLATSSGPGPQRMVSESSSPTLVSPISTPTLTSNGYRSRETGIVEKLLVSYGFIKCADREGRLFFHYSQYHGEAPSLRVGDEVEFEVSMDSRTGKPVAIQVIRLQKGTVMFEILSEDRVLGEVTSPAPPTTTLITGQATVSTIPGMAGVAGHGYKPSEKGEPVLSSGRLGSLSYERSGEFFFLPYSAQDLTNPNLVLCTGDKVSFNIATEKRSGIMRARRITLVERAPPKRFLGIVTAMKESFGFIERADQVKEIFFHYSEVTANVPDLNIGDHVEFSIHERNNKDVATEIRLLPHGSVQLEEVSARTYVGSIEKPLPAKTPNKGSTENSIAGGDATSPNQASKNGQVAANGAQLQPSLALAGIISYDTPTEKKNIRFGEKDRAANCLHTLCKGDRVSFVTITDKRDHQQRAAGVTLLLEETLQISQEKRERGIVAAVKEGFGFIKCLERDSRLFFHCCELLDPRHHVRMSDEVEFTVLPDPVAEKQRMHATRIKLLPKNTVIFHNVSEERFCGTIESMPIQSRPAPRSPGEFLSSPHSTGTPGKIVLNKEKCDSDQELEGELNNGRSPTRLSFMTKDFKSPSSSNARVGDRVEFKICEVKRSGAKNAVDIVVTRLKNSEASNGASRNRSQSHSISTSSDKLSPLYEESPSGNIIQVMSNMSMDESSTDPTNSPPPELEKGKSNLVLKLPTSESGSPEKFIFTTNSECTDTACTPRDSVKSPAKVVSSSDEREHGASSNTCYYGWISTLKDTFGFIEDMEHNAEVFFHYSELQAPVEKYRTGLPVSYFKGVKDEKPCALHVEISSETKFGLNAVTNSKSNKGKVLKPLRSVNPSQSSYQGLIEYKETNSAGDTTIKTIAYSPLSLSDRRDFIQIGDKVTFQVSTEMSNGMQRAVNVKVNRETVRATVDSIKGDYGFINYEVSGGEPGNGKLFFHMSEVREPSQQISAGSTVDFSVVYNQRSGKFSASKVRLAEIQQKQQRPERLRMRSSEVSSGPQVTVIRQPRGPSEEKQGFTLTRKKTPTKNDAESVSG